MSRFRFQGTKFRIPVEVAGLFVLTLSLQAAASTGPSWLQQPTWAKGVTGDRTPDRRPALAREDTALTSPFAPGSNNLALDVGQIFLMGDLGRYSDSIGAQLHYTYGVSELFGFDSMLGYSEHANGKFSMLTAVTGLRTNLAWYDKVVPYFVFGMGFYRPSYRTTAVSANEGNDNVALPAGTSVAPLLFGVHMGPGVDLEITKTIFFGASLTFHDVFGSTRFVNDVPVSVGGTFSSFLLHAGTTF
ncbi:MAG: hypothetical protein A2X94_12235 [Bdellovibrionales bacterium GWB1_55_8]|nr:MAG: hypothetical protein A2X94_12235 [Bdellovibrionales bacterium GWB1_55_8]